jgi:hypothetical protein
MKLALLHKPPTVQLSKNFKEESSFDEKWWAVDFNERE